MGILKTKFDAFIAGPLTDLLEFLNKSLSADATDAQFRKFRRSLKGSQKEFFEQMKDSEHFKPNPDKNQKSFFDKVKDMFS